MKTMAVTIASVLLMGTVSVSTAQEQSTVNLKRIDKAILIPANEMGEIAVYAWAEPVSETSTRHRYTYRVLYREGFPAIVPFAHNPGTGTTPLTGVSIHGDPDCDFQMVATPSRHEHGPWSWTSLSGGSLNYDTPSRRWMPSEHGHRFTFTSACAPAEGAEAQGGIDGGEHEVDGEPDEGEEDARP